MNGGSRFSLSKILYAGDAAIPVDLSIVQSAIEQLDAAGEAYAGYALDFGVLASGQTALVELNDSFALGAYRIDRQNYTDLRWARWLELSEQVDSTTLPLSNSQAQ